MTPTIGAMLSDAVLEELQKKMKESGFWKELDSLSQQYYPQAETQSDINQQNGIFSDFDISALKNKLFKL